MKIKEKKGEEGKEDFRGNSWRIRSVQMSINTVENSRRKLCIIDITPIKMLIESIPNLYVKLRELFL